jgi:hypothetical protein
MPALDTRAGLFWCAVLPSASEHHNPKNVGKRASSTHEALQLPLILSLQQANIAFVTRDIRLPLPPLRLPRSARANLRSPG